MGGSSGIALAQHRSGRWHILAVAPSYTSFVELAQGKVVDWTGRHVGTMPDIGKLIAAAKDLAGASVDLIAADMPLSKGRIIGRRSADDAVSREYGGRWCGTHSPSVGRPGALSIAIRDQAEYLGYRLATAASTDRTRGLLETYPHPVVLDLLAASRRVEYKVQKRAKYWPLLTPDARLEQVFNNINLIIAALRSYMNDIVLPLDPRSSPSLLKKIEDAVDALVCCWVGICWLEDEVRAYGDDEATIWLPAAKAPMAVGG